MKKEKILTIKSEIEGAQFEITREMKKYKNSRDKAVCVANYNRLETIIKKLDEILARGNGIIEECDNTTTEKTTEYSGEKPNTSTKNQGK